MSIFGLLWTKTWVKRDIRVMSEKCRRLMAATLYAEMSANSMLEQSRAVC